MPSMMTAANCCIPLRDARSRRNDGIESSRHPDRWQDQRVEAAFQSGTALAARYYGEVVWPLLDRHTPGLPHAAALIGWGSEVLGFDSPRSTDHNWGPRCQIFLGPGDADRAADITAMLADRLPEKFAGWPTRFPDVTARNPAARHPGEVTELCQWLTDHLGFDPRAGVGLLDWLATPTQVLAEVTSGAVFNDGLEAGAGGSAGGLDAGRAAPARDPAYVWRHLVARPWGRLCQADASPARCAEGGDELGSAAG